MTTQTVMAFETKELATGISTDLKLRGYDVTEFSYSISLFAWTMGTSAPKEIVAIAMLDMAAYGLVDAA